MEWPRYVKEYANDKRRAIKKNELMRPEFKRAIIEKIDRNIAMYERGFITVDEVMLLIAQS